MRRTVVLILVLLLLTLNLTWAQTASPTPSSPLSTPTVTVTPTPRPVELPDPVGGWWKATRQLAVRHGWWVAVGVISLLVPLYFLWKVGEEVAGEEAKNVATRLRQGARVTWCRLVRRPTREEKAIIKDVRTTCKRLELKGFVKEHLIIVSLESVYVPLTTRGPTGGDGRDLGQGMGLLRATEPAGEVPLTDLLARHPRLVLVGEAGSGKTTFLKYVALSAANACAGRGPDGVEWLRDDPPLPLFLPLHGLGVYLSDQKPADREWPNPDLLRDYVAHHLRHLALPEGWIVDRLEAGNVLILLDGLDEVARFEDRRFIAELVTRFATFYDGCQTIVTTRPQGYEGAAQLGGDFERRAINPLSWPEDIRTFLYRWNEAIRRRAAAGTLSAQERRRARDNADDLMVRLEVAENVRELANNPLLLTVMAIVHYNIGTLPERRADLYDAATELLLGWDKRMGRRLQAPPPWLDALTAGQRRLPLEELALDFQERRDLERPRSEVVAFLGDHFLAGSGPEAEEAGRVQAEEYLTWVTRRTYVLQEISGAIRFYRKPFQEYLAARRLARRRDLPVQVREILAEDWRDRWWDETLLLTVGHLITENPPRASGLLTSILEVDDPPEAPHYNAIFVARALADVPEGLLGSVWEVKERTAQDLAAAVAGVEPAFDPPARLEAGVALGTLGDPRPGTGAVKPAPEQRPLPDLVWVPVPGGSFLMGSTDDEVERWKAWAQERLEDGTYRSEDLTQEEVLEILWAWLEGERGRHELDLPAFLVTRYPVTNAQYRCFAGADGHDDPAWWGGEESPAWAWRQGAPRHDWQRTDRPDFWHDPRFNGPNQPVVGVTWYEALAFCRWLTARLKAQEGDLRIWRDGRIEVVSAAPETPGVRLPTEAEWEKAMRGTDGRIWPWGDGWDAAHSNTAEGDLGQTSPVGVLPRGDSPYGVADAAGNVWEWTSSLWGPDWRRPAFGYPYRADDGREDASAGDEVARVVRGGSWDFNRFNARCAARGRDYPDLSYRGLGFRCVSPVSLF
jgi:formylglycine-generating enzyme required for sulfatase activity